MSETKYRNCTITYNPKPIPIRDLDWDWVHDDYDGPGDNRYGSASSELSCKEQIDDCLAELTEGVKPGDCIIANGAWMQVEWCNADHFGAIDQNGGDHMLRYGAIDHVYD